VRAVNEDEGIISDTEFGPFVKEGLAECDADQDKALNAGEFLAFFKSFCLKVGVGRQAEEVRRLAKEMKKKGILPPYKISGDASKFVGDGTWECSVSVKGQVMDAVKSAWNKKKTPLLIDASSEDRDDPMPTPLDELFGGAYRGMDSFMSYAGGRFEVLDLKKEVLAVNIAKSGSQRDWSMVQTEYRKRVVKSMSEGDVLVLQMSTACPPLRSKLFDPAAFPAELLNSKLAQAVRGQDEQSLALKWTGKMIGKDDKLYKIDEEWNVMAISKFTPEDYARFLQDEFPLDLCQPIVVK